MDKEQIYETLKSITCEENVLLDEPMKKHTSFKVGGVADFFIKVKNIEQLKKILEFAKINKIPINIIGNGTNLLVKDNGVRGIVLKLDFKEIKIEENTIVTVGAGVLLAQLAQKLLQQSITGFEFAAGIPGTIRWSY